MKASKFEAFIASFSVMRFLVLAISFPLHSVPIQSPARKLPRRSRQNRERAQLHYTERHQVTPIAHHRLTIIQTPLARYRAIRQWRSHGEKKLIRCIETRLLIEGLPREPPRDGERDVRRFDRCGLAASIIVAPNFSASAGGIPSASHCATKAAKLPVFMASFSVMRFLPI